MKFVLAPLAGFTDAPFRRLCFEGGADLSYTEMVSAAGLAHGSSPTRHLMETMPGEGPVACQLFGARESDLAFAAHEATACRADDGSPRFVELNLNAGCPMTKVTREGAGAKLAEDPEKVYRLLKAMVENTDLPVTLKTRLGPHPRRRTVFELLDAAEQAGAMVLADKPVNCALEIMNRRMGERLTVSDIAAECYMSTDGFIRKFTRAVGMTPYAYFKNLRLRAAAALRESGATAAEAAEKCGYSDAAALLHAMKRRG